eukprot:7317896-Heterocapsa_arctica.AAC.1
MLGRSLPCTSSLAASPLAACEDQKLALEVCWVVVVSSPLDEEDALPGGPALTTSKVGGDFAMSAYPEGGTDGDPSMSPLVLLPLVPAGGTLVINGLDFGVGGGTTRSAH